MIRVIAGAELRRLFCSPIAWAVLAVVQGILALLFLVFVENFLTQVQPRFAGVEGAPGITDIVVSPLLMWAGIVMLAVIPLLSMRLIAEERAQASLPVYLASPVSAWQIVLGKYLGLAGLLLAMVCITALMPLSLVPFSGLDWGKFAAGLLGLVLLTGSFAAAGLWLSALSAQPVIAAVAAYGLLLFLSVLYLSGSSPGSASELFVYLSHFAHFRSFLDGVFDTADAAYYLLFTVVFLALAARRLDADRVLG